MRARPPVPTHAYAPYADRAGPGARAGAPEGLLRWLAVLIFFFMEPLGAFRMLRAGRLTSWGHDRPDLPAGSAQEEAAVIRGSFGTAIAWMCLRDGIGPGHADWPELSRAIVTFGGSLKRFRPGLPALGRQWWESPSIVPSMVPVVHAPAAAAVARLVRQDGARALPPASNEMQAEAAHGRLPGSGLTASGLTASGRHVFARAGPGPSTGPPRCPGLPNFIMSDARGRSMASPAVLIRAA